MSDSGEHTFSMILIASVSLFHAVLVTTYIYIYIYIYIHKKNSSFFSCQISDTNTSNRSLSRFRAGN